MDATSILALTSADDIRQTAESNQSLSLTDVLDGLCKCAHIAVELARDAGSEQAASFADTIYERAQNLAHGLGYRLALAPSMTGDFIAVELQSEPDDEWRRR